MGLLYTWLAVYDALGSAKVCSKITRYFSEICNQLTQIQCRHSNRLL